LDLISFQLEPVPPFRLDLTVWALRRRSDNMTDRWDGQTYQRVLVLEGRPVEVAATQTGLSDNPRLQITAKGERLTSGMEGALSTILQKMLGIRTNLAGFYRFATGDEKLSPLAERFRGVKPPRFPSIFEGMVNGIACQQLTLTVGILLLNRLAQSCGRAMSGEAASAHAFPRPEDLAGLEMETFQELGFSRQKGRALIELSQGILEGKVDLENLPSLDDRTAEEQLRQLRGVGRWTAEYVLLRGLGRLHIFPSGDVGARNKLRRLLNLKRPLDWEGVGRVLARWKPYAGFIYLHLLLDNLAEQGYVR
jgi:DNA-3-methyladenine glycosylase II